MRIFVLGDLHLDLAPRSGVDRWSDMRAQLERVASMVESEKPDVFVQLGDISDPDSGPRLLRAVIEFRRFLIRISKHVPARILLAGNHDCVDIASYDLYRSVVSAFGDLAEVYEEPDIRRSMECTMILLPYISGAHVPRDPVLGRMSAQDWLEHTTNNFLRNGNLQTPVYVFCHLDIEGATVGSEGRMLRGGKLFLPKAIEESPLVDRIVGGHIHKRQTIRFKVEIVGSFERTSFDEAEDPKGVLIFEIPDAKINGDERAAGRTPEASPRKATDGDDGQTVPLPDFVRRSRRIGFE